jgi:hypothetical protein
MKTQIKIGLFRLTPLFTNGVFGVLIERRAAHPFAV